MPFVNNRPAGWLFQLLLSNAIIDLAESNFLCYIFCPAWPNVLNLSVRLDQLLSLPSNDVPVNGLWMLGLKSNKHQVDELLDRGKYYVVRFSSGQVRKSTRFVRATI